MITDFEHCLRISKGDDHQEVIQRWLGDSCANVRESTRDEERRGIDYVATLRGGREIGIDVKMRQNCTRYWRNSRDPDLTLEVWSVLEKRVTGWTLSESKETEFILWTWPEDESDIRIMMPFQSLRMVFRQHCREWADLYGVKKMRTQRGGKEWTSVCVYVPFSVVHGAIDVVNEQRAERKREADRQLAMFDDEEPF